MDVRAIDHVNFLIPEDRVDEALDFYRDTLGFGVEDLEAYREGDRPLFTFRLGETCVIHVSPTDEFEEPSERNLRHVCLVLEATRDEVRAAIEDAGYEVRRESNPKGATGRNPAIYVEDPFGYVLELKEAEGVERDEAEGA